MTISLEPDSVAHRLYLGELDWYLRESTQILAAWDAYSAAHCDPETLQPFDEPAYGRRQRKRDADTLDSFGTVYYHADELVDVAERQLAQLAHSDRTRRYASQVRQLNTSTQRLYACYDEWLARRDALPAHAMPGTSAFEEPRAECYADAWHYLNEWSLHGQVLIDIWALARKRPPTASRTPAIGPRPPHSGRGR